MVVVPLHAWSYAHWTDSTLALDRSGLRGPVGRRLGYTSDSTSWSTGEETDIAECLDSGLRDFLSAHDWTFSKPWDQLVLVADQYEYDLPPIFGGILDRMYYTDTAAWRGTIEEVTVGDIMLYRQQGTATGDPKVFAIRHKISGSEAQRSEVLFYPTPSASRVVSYQYMLNFDAVATGNTWPPGSAQHAETIKFACLAAAERLFKGGPAQDTQEYMRLLVQSRQRDGLVARSMIRPDLNYSRMSGRGGRGHYPASWDYALVGYR